MRYTKLIVLILAVILCVGLLAGAIIRTNNATPAVKHTAKETSESVERGVQPEGIVLLFAHDSSDLDFDVPFQIVVDNELIDLSDYRIVDENEHLYLDQVFLLPQDGFQIVFGETAGESKAGPPEIHVFTVNYDGEVLEYPCKSVDDPLDVTSDIQFVLISPYVK
ncbi:MAG: hypothetical protein J6Z04_06705 [Clostridia bacterium]|nr:hypothetical protein [Clostridia bacterium]